MKLYLGAECILSPLADGATENFEKMKSNISGITLQKQIGFNKEDLFVSKWDARYPRHFDALLEQCIHRIELQVGKQLLRSDKTIVVLSTTKGNLETDFQSAIYSSAILLQQKFELKHFPCVISNGCASGVIAINTAADLIRSAEFDHALILGCDMLSDFVLFGFQSLFAVSNEACKPFDVKRKGINLGEACAGFWMTNDSKTFSESSIQYISGSASNDANHISGPSRTGEGLYRTVKRTFELGKIQSDEIDFVSAHGTGTLYNDDMESIAFNRLGLKDVPLNSLKGYFGHTLGAAGILETIICMQSMRRNYVLKSLGYESQGTPEKLNMVTSSFEKNVTTVLKTVSGFGGCNASLILKKS